jgi:hypothetical protein
MGMALLLTFERRIVRKQIMTDREKGTRLQPRCALVLEFPLDISSRDGVTFGSILIVSVTFLRNDGSGETILHNNAHAAIL